MVSVLQNFASLINHFCYRQPKSAPQNMKLRRIPHFIEYHPELCHQPNIIQKPLTTQSKSIKMKERSTSNIETNSTIDMNRSSNKKTNSITQNRTPPLTWTKPLNFGSDLIFQSPMSHYVRWRKTLNFAPTKWTRRKAMKKQRKEEKWREFGKYIH